MWVKSSLEERRRKMVAAVRRNQSMRSVATKFAVSLSTVQRWVTHAHGQRLDRVDWSDSRGGRREAQATDQRVEELIIELRNELKQRSDLGEYGAAAIRRELIALREKLRLKQAPSRCAARRDSHEW